MFFRSFFLVLLLLSMDLATKYFFRFFEGGIELPLVFIADYLYVDNVLFNHTGLFDEEHNDPDQVTVLSQFLFYVVATFSLIGLSIGLYDEDETSLSQRISRLVMIAGVLGNVLDKAYFGNVCDWLTITRPEITQYYAINFADIFITLGLFGFAFELFEEAVPRLIWLGYALVSTVWSFQILFFV